VFQSAAVPESVGVFHRVSDGGVGFRKILPQIQEQPQIFAYCHSGAPEPRVDLGVERRVTLAEVRREGFPQIQGRLRMMELGCFNLRLFLNLWGFFHRVSDGDMGFRKILPQIQEQPQIFAYCHSGAPEPRVDWV
jgi:hypothetical protein